MNKPRAFLSYVRADNKDGYLTTLQERLSEEIRLQTGEEFPIFQDWKDIGWGKNWRKEIRESLEDALFFIPILTPAYFKSGPCRDELMLFLEREKKLERDDLILTVYYVNCAALNDKVKRAKDELAEVIGSRNYVDWRELRFEPFTSPQIRRLLAQLGSQVCDALESLAPAEAQGATASAPEVVSAVGEARTTTPLASSRAEGTLGKIEIAGVTLHLEPAERGPTTKNEPKIRIVDPNERGKFSTISAAIAKADPGDKIVVRPGVYEEGLVVDKSLEIVGEGKLGNVEVRASGQSALRFQTTLGRVVNLKLRQKGGEEWFCVDISQGRLELEGCDITSESLSCVAIHGGADPTLRRNRIHDGQSGGVFFYDNGSGTLEDNDIFGNALAGVAITEGSSPTLRRNRIHDGKQGGVMVYKNGQGALEDNDIFGNTFSGVEIREGGNPTLRRNRIHDGLVGGVLVGKNGQGMLEDNDILSNGLAGVEIKEGGNPTLRRNRIHDGKYSGVYVHENGQGTLEENDIFGNAASGVQITTSGNPTLRRNRIHDGKSAGVYVYDNGQGTLEENDIFGNASLGVLTETGGNPTLRRNRIYDGKAFGVVVRENGRGELEENDIFGNAKGGVAIKSGGRPTLRRNRIIKNGYEAVWVYEGGGGVFEQNDLRENKKAAWKISEDCMANVKREGNIE